MPMSLVILSSDDEDENSTKKSKIDENSTKKPQNSNKMEVKTVNVLKDVPVRKRKSSTDSTESLRKKTKTPKPSTSGTVNSSHTKASIVVDLTGKPVNRASTSLADKPTLVVTKKHQIKESTKAEELFAMFLSQCMTRERSKDMEKIVEKLKRLFEEMDPEYAASEPFTNLLNEKRDCLMREEGLLYTHIADIKEEMKLGKKGKNPPKSPPPDCPANGGQSDEQNVEDDAQIAKHNYKLQQLEIAMEKCQKRIKQLEETEVNFDEEDDSSYLKVHRYKERAVELYKKWCELTGNHSDAGRSYLRPKYYKLTDIPAVNQAINSFINAKLSKSKEKKKNVQNAVQNMVFPDYHDIYKLIHTHNVNKNLGLDTKTERRNAKEAFTKLGKHLKNERQKDFFDTFSVLYENSKDPALNDQELAIKLKQNHEAGVEKLNSIFEKYCVKQDEMKNSGKDNSTEPESHSTDDSQSEDEEEGEIVLSDVEIVELDSPESLDESKNDEKADKTSEKNENNVKIVEKKSLDDRKGILKNVEVEKSSIIVEKLSIDSGIVVDLKPPSCENVKTTDTEEIIVENGEKPRKMAEKSIKIVENTLENIIPLNSHDKTDDSSDKNNVTENSKEVIHIDEPSKTIIKPLLKLKSFAKPSEFWENCQEVKKPTDVTEKLVEIIELDDTEETKKPSSVACSKRKTTPGSRYVIFKNLIPIPASKIPKNRMIRPKLLPPVSAIRRLVPLSSTEIRRCQTSRPVAHIIGQRATKTLIQYSKNTDKHVAGVEIGGNRSDNYVPLKITKKTVFTKK